MFVMYLLVLNTRLRIPNIMYFRFFIEQLCLLSEVSVYSKLNVVLFKNNSFVLTLNELSPT